MVPANPNALARGLGATDEQLAAMKELGEFILATPPTPIRRRAFTLDRARNVIKHSPLKYAQVRAPHKKDGIHYFSMLMPRGSVRSGSTKQRAPHPRGASGGGVFALSGPRPRLAGIFIEYRDRHRLVSTKANRIFAFI